MSGVISYEMKKEFTTEEDPRSFILVSFFSKVMLWVVSQLVFLMPAGADLITHLSRASFSTMLLKSLIKPVVLFIFRAPEERVVKRENLALQELLDPPAPADPLEMMVPRETLYVSHTHTHTQSHDWCIIRAVCGLSVKLSSVMSKINLLCLRLSAGSCRLPRRPRSPWWAWCCCKCWLYTLISLTLGYIELNQVE